MSYTTVESLIKKHGVKTLNFNLFNTKSHLLKYMNIFQCCYFPMVLNQLIAEYVNNYFLLLYIQHEMDIEILFSTIQGITYHMDFCENPYYGKNLPLLLNHKEPRWDKCTDNRRNHASCLKCYEGFLQPSNVLQFFKFNEFLEVEM